ncbi:uncharacterized protein LOC129728161 [Wyeomyia smithii]|uniref:uncharacterized protein LOC129728161 n=1 Tax=Wyeomyia smithii TaxID=174621 RepID=UPI002468157C|nr:uncharacterized protein LOC129728161 [Wyeomyia smithii]
MARHDTASRCRDCLYLVHFKKGTITLGALKAIRVIQDIIVTWEAYRATSNGVTQCMQCLNFGHGTRNCRPKARCNFCSLGHSSDSCPIEGAVDYKCANCNGPHQASDRICNKREEYKNIRKQASTSNQPGRRRDRFPPPVPVFDENNYPTLQSNYRNQQMPITQAASAMQPPPQHAEGADRRSRTENRSPPGF